MKCSVPVNRIGFARATEVTSVVGSVWRRRSAVPRGGLASDKPAPSVFTVIMCVSMTVVTQRVPGGYQFLGCGIT